MILLCRQIDLRFTDRSGVSALLNRINATNLRGDVFGGLTAAVIALPMALAFGIAVGNASGVPGAGAAAGLWGAVIIGLVASLFGGTPTLISEPTGPMTVVFTSVVISFSSSAESPEKALAMAFGVGVLAERTASTKVRAMRRPSRLR